MSMLTVVRHGQASLFAADYDRLSDVGEQQAAALGAYWARHGVRIDAAYSGPRIRHRRFAELTATSYRDHGGNWPDIVVLNELDEFDLEGLSKRLIPALTGRDPDFDRLQREFAESSMDSDRDRQFQRMFEIVMRHWQAPDIEVTEFESWQAFRERVAGIFRRIQQSASRRTHTVAFTSGGVIGCLLQHALDVSDATMRELCWRIRNGSLTDFVFTPERFTLDAFNAIPHLTDSALWTYR